MLLCESVHTTPLGLVFMLLCESVCTHYPSPVSMCTLPLPWVWCSCCSVSLSVHNNPPLGLVLMLLCESVCTHYPSTGFGVHVALWVCLYTITLPWDWCSCCSVSMSVHNNPPLGLVFMLLCVCLYTIPLPWVWCSCCSVSVCTHYSSPVSLSVHTTPPLWVCLYTLLLPC